MESYICNSTSVIWNHMQLNQYDMESCNSTSVIWNYVQLNQYDMELNIQLNQYDTELYTIQKIIKNNMMKS